MIDPFDHPFGWNLTNEILATLSTAPAKLADLADDFGVSAAAIRGALYGVEGVCLGGNLDVGLTVWLAPSAVEPVRQRVLTYWRGVYEHEPALA